VRAKSHSQNYLVMVDYVYFISLLLGRRRGNVPPHVPERVMRVNNRVKRISPHLLPQPQHAVQQYRLNGGQITDPDQNITDPLLNAATKISIRS